MPPIVIEQRVDNDGVLRISLTLGTAEADRDVRVTVESLANETAMSQEQWQSGILSTAGGWQGDFERPPQEPLEEREPLS
ncbi:MAG TPA: hypothetical protein VHR72_04105 [Gemmataceae bacterium]|jgi:hypothetical protein|nr:hypothetical protein [Gemmataceae bacterium]